MRRRVIVAPAERIHKLPSPFLGELDGLKRSLTRRGQEITDLSRFSLTVAAPAMAVKDTAIKDIFSEYLTAAYGARINPDKEMLLLPSGRATLLLLGTYFIDTDRVCYAPDPGFSAYRNIGLLFGGKIEKYPLYQRNDFLPNLKQFERRNSGKLKILLLNSPHNPTGAVCDKSFFLKLEQLAARENMLVVVDSSYSLNAIGNFRPPLYCEIRKRLKTGLEMFALSTNLCAPDLKLSILVGRREFIAPLARLANSFGLIPCPTSVQAAGRFFADIDVLQSHIEHCRAEIAARTEIITAHLNDAGIEYHPVVTTPFIWVKLKPGRVSLSFARALLRRKGIAVAPGSAFGEEGEGWVRIAANVGGDKLAGAMREFVRHYQPIKARLRQRKGG